MTLSAAPSTPRPLPRQRGDEERRPRLSLAGAVPAHSTSVDAERSGLTPAIQKEEAPRTRRKQIQTNEATPDTRRGHLARLDALRVEIRALVDEIALGADIDLLDLMRDEVGSYSRHKAAQEARTWAEQAGLTIETGLMQLDRALRPITK